MKKYSEISHFMRYDMWRRTATEFRNPVQRIGYLLLRTIVLVARGFTSKNLNNTAKSLTFSLTFALVPILAMVIAIAKGFGVADTIEQYLNSTFLGEAGMVPTIMQMVDRYLETAQGGVFIGIGILILLWAIYSFFESVEQAFNRIWNVKKNRSIIHKFLQQWYRCICRILDSQLGLRSVPDQLGVLHVDLHRLPEHARALHLRSDTRYIDGYAI